MLFRSVARERSRAGRTGVFDVEVQDQNGETIALFRGTSYRIEGFVIPSVGPEGAEVEG